MERLWVLVFSPCSGPSQLPYWSSVGVPAREACGRGSCYHHKGLCCGHRRSERDGWDSPGETSDGLCVYVWCLAFETSTPHWSSFLGLISRPWGSNGSPIWALRVSSRTDSNSQGYSFAGAKVFEKLQALFVSKMCMDFAPGLFKVTLRLRPGYVPKVLSESFCSHVVTLHSFHPPVFASGEDERLHMLCPVDLWRSMWTAPAIGGNLPSCWYVLVLVAMGLPHRSTEFLTGWILWDA